MKALTCVVVAAVLAGSLAGCADPYYAYRYPAYGYSQAYHYPSSYSYYPAYSYPSYYSHWDYYRNYNGIHPGPEVSAMAL